MPTILSTTPDDIRVAGEALRGGFLVAFPTETVYGLGANALDGGACAAVYAAKGRPATDPLICHVATPADAPALWDDPPAAAVAAALGRAFWPGPLTVVARAAAGVPAEVTGGSGAVGVRVPAHADARALIVAAGVPIAAPSANTWGHVSPTTAAHVVEDLGARCPNLIVVDGGATRIGIESTVVRVAEGRVEVIRRGWITPSEIQRALEKEGWDTVVTVRETRGGHAERAGAMDAPGQCLTHYAPNLPTFLLSPPENSGPWTHLTFGSGSSQQCFPLSVVVVVDVGGALAALLQGSPAPIAIFSLSDRGDVEEACRSAFDVLRRTEGVAGAKAVVVPLVGAWGMKSEVAEALEDRLFRSASGRSGKLSLMDQA